VTYLVFFAIVFFVFIFAIKRQILKIHAINRNESDDSKIHKIRQIGADVAV
jgi:phosphotransferase system  glucose/maltose/N-acetylglucosamine-specific IIC component